MAKENSPLDGELFRVSPILTSPKVVITLPVLLRGGTEMQTLTLVKVLIKAGCKVVVCCFYESDPTMIAMMQQAGAVVVLLEQGWEKGCWVLLKAVTRFMRHENPDIVHVQYMAPGFIAVLGARLAGVRTVFATVHQPGRTYGYKAKLLLNVAAKLCTTFFCISRSVEESWFGNSAVFDPSRSDKRRHCTIYNAVDVPAIRALVAQGEKQKLRQHLGLHSVPVIGCIGRLRCEKGQIILIEAMAEVLKFFPSVQLVLIGDGPDWSMLCNRIDELGLRDNVRMLGSMSQDDVFRHLSVMDLMAVPSLFEGFGLVAAESMAAGLPVVGSDVDGLAELIEDGVTGYLVEPSDSSALANALLKLLSNPEQAKEFGLRGQDRVMQYFSMGQFGESMLGFYKQHPGQTFSLSWKEKQNVK